MRTSPVWQTLVEQRILGRDLEFAASHTMIEVTWNFVHCGFKAISKLEEVARPNPFTAIYVAS